MLHITVPRGTPIPFEGHNTSSTSLKATWGKVPLPDRLGIILGYRVNLSRAETVDIVVQSKVILVPIQTTHFTGLEKFAAYALSVAAFNSKGSGPGSTIIVRTDEDSK